tara:strand:- start:227 stop:877 length:651 start_codon:yes stop_codon:yes gene_type:complete
VICNHCKISFKPEQNFIGSAYDTDHNLRYDFEKYDCPECLRANIFMIIFTLGGMTGDIELRRRIIEPPNSTHQELPVDVPEHFRTDFSEASQVLDISPKASAALSRRLLEGILIENGAPSNKNLFQQIDDAISDGMPSYIAEQLDYIRQIGKFAAHSKSNRASGEVIDVDYEEAEAVLSIIDLLCDHYYVMPAKAKRRQQQLETKLAAARAKPADD